MSTTTTSQKKITCRAVVCWAAGESPEVVDITVEPPKTGEVRIKMLFASLCHTDVLCCKGFPAPVFPRVLGHEGVGIVESLGEGIDPKQLKVGDMVIPTYLGECKECENCTSGRTNLCVTYPLQAFTGLMPDGTSRMSSSTANGGGVRSLYHFLSCSTWSQYTVVDANYVVKVDPRIPLPHASFLSCGFTTGFGATWKEAKIQKGASTVAVLGLGAVGLGAIEGARVHGATKIIGVDINEIKCEIGKAFGMTHYINPRGEEASGRSISELVKELTDGKGVDFSFECTGVPELVNQALESTKVGLGRMIMLGAGTQKTIDIDFGSLLCCREFKYSVFGGVKVQSDLPVIIGKCIDKEIQKLDQLQTYEVHFEDIHKAFELLKEPDCVKVLIKL